MAMIDRVCCECLKVYGQKEGGTETRPTHGLCDGCAEKANAEVDPYFATRPGTYTCGRGSAVKAAIQEAIDGRI